MPTKAETKRKIINKAKAENGENMLVISSSKTRVATNILFISIELRDRVTTSYQVNSHYDLLTSNRSNISAETALAHYWTIALSLVVIKFHSLLEHRLNSNMGGIAESF